MLIAVRTVLTIELWVLHLMIMLQAMMTALWLQRTASLHFIKIFTEKNQWYNNVNLC